MKTRIIRTIAAGLAVVALALGGPAMAAQPTGKPLADTSWT